MLFAGFGENYTSRSADCHQIDRDTNKVRMDCVSLTPKLSFSLVRLFPLTHTDHHRTHTYCTHRHTNTHTQTHTTRLSSCCQGDRHTRALTQEVWDCFSTPPKQERDGSCRTAVPIRPRTLQTTTFTPPSVQLGQHFGGQNTT